MRSLSLVLVLLATLLTLSPQASARQASPVPTNLGFEDGQSGQIPSGWFLPVPGYSAALLPDGAQEGNLCLRLAPDKPDAPFGNIMQAFDAVPFRGKRIVFEGWVRCETQGRGSAQLWLRVDRAGDRMGLFDNMGDRPIRDPQWKKYRITGDVDPDAQFINIGLLVSGGATAWADGFSIRAAGPAGEGNEKPRSITDRGMLNLIALTRLSGYIRFFHPSTESLGINWDSLMLAAIAAAEPASSPAELAAALERSFRPIAPSIRVWAGTPADAPPADPRPPDADGAVAWKHTGVSFSDNPDSPYSSLRFTAALGSETGEGIPAAGTSVVKDLGGGVCCRVPVSLCTKGGTTLPRSPDATLLPANKPTDWDPSAADRTTRLAAVMLAWNVLENFYPYFDVVGVDWPAALPEALHAAATDSGPAEFIHTLRVLNAKVHDGHGGIGGPGDPGLPPLDLDWVWVGDDLVIARTPAGNAAIGLAPGDVVQSIDSIPVSDCYRQVCEVISAAGEPWRRIRALYELKSWPRGQAATIIARRGSGETAKPVVTVVSRAASRNLHSDGISRPMSGAEISPGIIYFDLVGADAESLSRVMPRLQSAKGIIFDVRGYPADAAIEVIRHLSDQTLSSARWMLPVETLPDREAMTFKPAASWSLPPLEPRLATNIAFLTGGEAISYAESIMGIVENYKLGEIVGGPTAGTNGNVNPIPLPGGYTMMYTGMQVLKQDGSRHHGVGILPTVPCGRTIEGIAAGRDEVLEKAVEVVKAKLTSPAPK